MKKLALNAVTVFLAFGLVMGASAGIWACGPACCCHGDGANKAGQTSGVMLESAGNCCCDSISDYRGGSGTAAVTVADEYRVLSGATHAPATGSGVRPAGDRPIPLSHARACNSPPIYKLVSSYLI